MCKSLVISYWESILRQEAIFLPSMPFFNPAFHSLCKPHPVLWTAGANPHEVAKAVIQCKMLSGRYRTALLARHWSSNRNGWCPALCCKEIPESLEHILLWCPHYHQTREKIFRLWLSVTDANLHCILTSLLIGPPSCLLQFILDPSIHPSVISMNQLYGQETLKVVFYLTRTWCYSVHKERSKLQGRWNFS